MKGHGNRVEDVGQKSSKNREQEIKEPVVMRNLFWPWFLGGGEEEAALGCLLIPSALPATHRSAAESQGWEGG